MAKKKRMSQEGQIWSGILSQAKWEKLLKATIQTLREQGAAEARLVGDLLLDAGTQAELDSPKGLSQTQALAIANEFEKWAAYARHELSEKETSDVIDDLMNQGSAEAAAIADAVAEGASLNEIVDWAKFAEKKLKGGK